MYKKIPVQTSSIDNYEITIGSDLLDEVSQFISRHYGTNKIFIVIDEMVHEHHKFTIESRIAGTFSKVAKYVVPSGERSKSIEQYNSIVDFLLEDGSERGTPLLAIGGGVVGDLAGFVAASTLRGLPLIHVPTTLLAMVDSSIGGKTGINHSTGKNLIGAFYQPKAVFSDVDFLKTLPRKEWVNGLSEIIKYGMIESKDILDQLKKLTSEKDFAEPDAWVDIITQSASIKADIVSRDVKESGVREFLNFGHTYAHVIERKGNYTQYSHGEAVFAGMLGAIKASNELGADIDPANLLHFKPLYDVSLSAMGRDVSGFTKLMLRDKKVKDQTIRLVLLNELEDPVVRSFVDTAFIDQSWEEVIKEFN